MKQFHSRLFVINSYQSQSGQKKTLYVASDPTQCSYTVILHSADAVAQCRSTISTVLLYTLVIDSWTVSTASYQRSSDKLPTFASCMTIILNVKSICVELRI